MDRGRTRRELLRQAAAAGAAAAWTAEARPARAASPEEPPFRISLNTSTLRGHKLPLTDVIEIAAKAGYQGIEPWPDEIDRHVESGGTLKDVARRLKDRGLAVTGGITFFEWMVDDAARRAAGFEEARRRMAQIAEIGGTCIAAPPAGDVKGVDLLRAAERYRDLLEVGEKLGVAPSLEIWGFAPNLCRLGQAVMVAIEAQHPRATVLPDVFHLYKGGSGLDGIARVNPNILAGFHLNDYPATPPRETIRDASRVYPGDGVAPLPKLIRDLRSIGYRGPLSVELFNPEYYKQDPLLVARTALEKTQAVIRAALTT